MRGETFSAWRGDLLAGSLKDRALVCIRLENNRAVYAEPMSTGRRIRDLVEDASGRIVLWTDHGQVVSIMPALVLYVPWRAADKYYHYRGVQPGPASIAADPGFRNGLALVQGDRHVDWAAASFANEFPLGQSPAPVFAWDVDGRVRRAVLQAFPLRDVWLVLGPTRTGGDYQASQRDSSLLKP